MPVCTDRCFPEPDTPPPSKPQNASLENWSVLADADLNPWTGQVDAKAIRKAEVAGLGLPRFPNVGVDWRLYRGASRLVEALKGLIEIHGARGDQTPELRGPHCQSPDIAAAMLVIYAATGEMPT